MMDIRPLISSPEPLSSSRDPTSLRSLHNVFAPRESSSMIIDATTHNSSSLPVSPKQGETITADSLNKPEPQLVPSSMTPTSWEHLSSPQKSLSMSSSSTTAVLSQSWASPSSPRSSSPSTQAKTIPDSLDSSDKFRKSQLGSESQHCDSWNNGNGALKTITKSSASPPHHQIPSPSNRKDEEYSEEQEELPPTAISTSGISARNCDRPDSSPSPQSQLNSSFEESEHVVETNIMQNPDRFSAGNIGLDGSFERRSRRKPTIEDIVRRVRPPVDDPPYDSEESEIEDEILNEEMTKMSRENDNDEVDGNAKSGYRFDGERRFKENFTDDRLSRLEAVDGIQEDDDEDMDSDKHSIWKDVPGAIYDLMHEVKVNAHAMFMRTPKSSRDQSLVELLSKLRDRCLQDGLKPEVIGAILKDVESDVTFRSYNSSIDAPEEHFLSRPELKGEDSRDYKEPTSRESFFGNNPPSFFHPTTAPSSPPPSTSSSPSSSSSPTSESKPTIVTVSADIKPPPLSSAGGGLPPLHPLASNISETAFSPNMFGNGKMNWFPGGLNNMPIYPFSPAGGLDHALSRKFLPFEGKIGDNVDKDYLKCQFCERTFRRQKNLENHVENTHQGKGPLKPRRETNDMYFKCSHCPYTTKHQSNLYVHLRIHTGERPYICGACGVQYSQSHSLKSHIINKHDGIMSYYIKEKRTRSPRGMGYLSTQVMHDNSIFKLPPPPLLPSAMAHNNLDLVTKALEMAKSEHAQHQQQLQQQHLSPRDNHERSSERSNMPPPLTPTSVNNSNNLANTPNSNAKSPDAPRSGSNSNPPTPNNTLFSTPGSGPPPPFFMNGHQMSPLMFGELPPHIRNPGHMGGNHPAHLFPGFPHFPPHSSGFNGAAGLSPLSGLSPNSSSTPTPHQNMAPHLQLPVSLPHMSPSPIPLMQQHQIKKESPSTPVMKHSPRSQPDEAIDLRKKSPPLDNRDQHAHDLSMCVDKENCAHAAKLKYLRLNVVRMLGILVPNLNFAEKGISAESESVDELLQDVIESNTHDDDMME